MTRYSRSVLPGRAADEQQDPDSIDSTVFGAKRRIMPPAAPHAANDQREPDFLPTMDEDEADLLVSRSNTDRRHAPKDRRTAPVADRRQAVSGRRAAEYAPLRTEGQRKSSALDDNKRGPMLLVGALLIVAIFAFVVWNAYRDGLQSDEVEVTPELSTAGSFKTPPRAVAPAPIVTEPTETVSDIPLDGGPSAVDALDEQRPVSLTPAPAPAPAKSVEAAATPAPAPSKVTATPPPALKQPVQVAPAPVKAATVPAAQPPAAKPAVVAAAPKPVPAPAATTSTKFAAYGDHVVQIAATQTEAAASAEWTKQLKAYPDLLTGGEKFIQQADVNGKTVYRLRVGSFASKADAAAFCTAFKAKGGNCYPALK